MAKCPNCNAEVDHLVDWSKEWVARKFTVDSEGYGDYQAAHDWDSADGSDDYCCPDCGAALFHDEEQAIAFLKEV